MGLDLRSLSLRRAWIEIVTQTLIKSQYGGRSPYGERGLKSLKDTERYTIERVALLTESVD